MRLHSKQAGKNREKNSQDRPNMLVCPLDWGLGHATRCIPLINELLAQQCNVIIAGSGRSFELLKSELPACSFIRLRSYKFFYNRKGFMALSMFLSAPFIILGIIREHYQLKAIIKAHHIHGVISDNRFGLWSNKVPCIYMTHQVRIKTGGLLHFLEPIFYWLHRLLIRKFDRLWIPDYGCKPFLTGELSHPLRLKIPRRYIGPLSRFMYMVDDNAVQANSDSYILVLISGPEPQRSIFEEMIISQAPSINEKIIMLRGLPGLVEKQVVKGNLTIYPHLETQDLNKLIMNATLIVSRSGYSTIMDLAITGKKAFFVPTPGQTEQEYLAAFLFKQGIANYCEQRKFNFSEVVNASANMKGFSGLNRETTLKTVVKEFVAGVRNKTDAP